MEKFGFVAVLVLLAMLLASCASVSRAEVRASSRPLNPDEQIIGTVRATFTTDGHSGSRNEIRLRVNRIAYGLLLEAANREFQGYIGVRDIRWAQRRNVRGRNMVEFTVHGQVISLGSGGRISATGVEGALERAAETIARNFPAGSRIAIAYISGAERGYASLFDGRLEHFFLMQGFNVFDRSQLDIVRAEQQLGLDFVVDERTAVRIGHITGVSVIITGKICTHILEIRKAKAGAC